MEELVKEMTLSHEKMMKKQEDLMRENQQLSQALRDQKAGRVRDAARAVMTLPDPKRPELGTPADGSEPAASDIGQSVSEASAHTRRAKLEKPVKFDGKKEDKGRPALNWLRQVALWRKLHEDVGDNAIAGLLMQAIGGDALELLMTKLSDEQLVDPDKILVVIKAVYGREDLLQGVASINKFRTFSREKNMKLSDFLSLYDAYRSEAIRHGLQESVQTDGFDLLNASEIGTAVKASILQQISTMAKAASLGQGKAPGYEDILG
ncbi:MAG: hypothetical protein VX683_06915, partial [Cyanobacteriota bacterium]|nr:hypothetical protein [Cyanobacteriota bacterium]